MDNILQELRQGMTQYVYRYYEELRRTYSEAEAKKQTLAVTSELLKPFIETSLAEVSLYSLLDNWEQEWLNKETRALKEKDYDLLEQSTDVLHSIKVLKPYAQTQEGE